MIKFSPFVIGSSIRAIRSSARATSKKRHRKYIFRTSIFSSTQRQKTVYGSSWVASCPTREYKTSKVFANFFFEFGNSKIFTPPGVSAPLNVLGILFCNVSAVQIMAVAVVVTSVFLVFFSNKNLAANAAALAAEIAFSEIFPSRV